MTSDYQDDFDDEYYDAINAAREEARDDFCDSMQMCLVCGTLWFDQHDVTVRECMNCGQAFCPNCSDDEDLEFCTACILGWELPDDY